VTKSGRVDVGPVAGHHPTGLQPVEAGLDGATGHPQAPGRLQHTHPGLGRKKLDQPGIKLIDHSSPFPDDKLCRYFLHGKLCSYARSSLG